MIVTAADSLMLRPRRLGIDCCNVSARKPVLFRPPTPPRGKGVIIPIIFLFGRPERLKYCRNYRWESLKG